MLLSDTRIPPYGFDYDEARRRNTLPVPETQFGNPGTGGTYQHWADHSVSIPLGAALTTVALSSTVGVPGEASLPTSVLEQMTAAYNDGTGAVDVLYTAACNAVDHNIYYGPLADVSSYAYTGAACAVGASGSASLDPGAGSFFFLIVGNDGGEEGSYGTDSGALERPEDVGGICDVPQQLADRCD